MTDKALTKNVVLDAAEKELMKYGWSRTTLVSIAKSLDVSHAALYSYFRSKATLRDAILERWLFKYSDQLEKIAGKDGETESILQEWFFRLFQLKKKELLENEELFTLNSSLVQQKNKVIQKHEERLVGQLENVINRGIERNEIEKQDSLFLAHTLFRLLSVFYHPAFSERWKEERINEEFQKSWEIVTCGIFRK
ncbi:TPA: TetR family transcriptional regulator [Bacillus pacificus]|uniref:TetR/AcrR family transcriptional regulator n=1 Tax=Bacillus cereus group TaxID=86661 RepID=UPI000772B071|nr:MULTISPECIES: TetR/AcrR family transcriptional regulator [Bacillus cereus group]KXI48579.1 transcriptional regulator [Bacillus cereus]MCC2391319.1 TetR family transcriptional regulator [Bacillus pacificus]MCC2472180.1 TetR family transcriptional regulator [Bacillus pacificus]MDA2136555.1 TetR/AcrR family transcriptional regulator [Bacillus cereus group sp. Bc256]MDA2768727.1 TetR/AcrR family transcriptional regulator [Bacillus cereus group sp. Bc010]